MITKRENIEANIFLMIYQTQRKEFAHIPGLESGNDTLFRFKLLVLVHLYVTGPTIQHRFRQLYRIHSGTWENLLSAFKSAKLIQTHRSKRFVRVFNSFVKVESYTLTTKGRQVTEQYLEYLRDKAAKIESGEINF